MFLFTFINYSPRHLTCTLTGKSVTVRANDWLIGSNLTNKIGLSFALQSFDNTNHILLELTYYKNIPLIVLYLEIMHVICHLL